MTDLPPPAVRDRPIELVCFDVDGTLVVETVYIWETLHRRFGSNGARRRRAREDFYAGRISYAEWFHHDIRLLRERGATRGSLEEVVASLAPAPGARETLETLKRRGYRLGVISGSIDLVVSRFFGDVGIDHILINRFHFDAQGLLVGGEPTPYDIAGKADGLRELARRERCPLEACAFVGDNKNDLAVMRAAGLAVAVNVKHPSVAEAADLVLPGADLRDLLPYLPPRSGPQA